MLSGVSFPKLGVQITRFLENSSTRSKYSKKSPSIEYSKIAKLPPVSRIGGEY
jgi:hypothetical protein